MPEEQEATRIPEWDICVDETKSVYIAMAENYEEEGGNTWLRCTRYETPPVVPDGHGSSSMRSKTARPHRPGSHDA